MELPAEAPRKHFVNRVTTFSKILSLVLFVLIPVFMLYVGYRQGIKEGVAAQEERISASDSKSSLPESITITPQVSVTHVSDTHTGLSFDYPSTWGPLEIHDEVGTCEEVTEQDPCNQRVYLFGNFDGGPIFLATETRGHQDNEVGRGWFWGDGAGLLEQNYLDECLNSPGCSRITNANGVNFSKRVDKEHSPDGAPPFDTATFYSTYNSQGPYHGLILSDARIRNSDAEITKLFEETVIQSLTLLPH